MMKPDNQDRPRIPNCASSLMLKHVSDSEANVACYDVNFNETFSNLFQFGFDVPADTITVVAKFLLTDPLPRTLQDILDLSITEQHYRLMLVNQAGHTIQHRDLILTPSSMSMPGNSFRSPARTRRPEGDVILDLYRNGSPRWQWFMRQSGETRDILANISQRLHNGFHFPEMHVTFSGRNTDNVPVVNPLP